MHMPNSLRIVALVFVTNGVLVGWSIVQRHVLVAAQTPINSQESATEFQERLRTLEPPEESGTATDSIPEGDLLLHEIRKQAAIQFPETLASTDSSESVTPAAMDSVATSNVNIRVMHQQLQATGHLREAAVLILKLAAHQQQQGQTEQANASLNRVRQLQSLMADLLSE